MDTIALDKLRFGHEATPPMNARLSGRESEVSELAASIAAHGLIQSLTVADQDGTFFVVDGNRRLAALKHMAMQGTIVADYPVRVDLAGGSGIEISLAANVMRLPMHEADVYVTMRELTSGGLTEDDIAGRFGIEKKRVRRMLALGAVAPVIVDAWREGRMGLDAVKAFTIADSVETQEKAFAAIKGAHYHPHAIRVAMGAANDLRKELGVVSLDEYRGAGGHVVEDLFGEEHNITDPDLLRTLFEQKISQLVDDLMADGWSWAARGEKLPDNWHYNWRTLSRVDVEPTTEESSLLRKLKKKMNAANTGTEEDDTPEEAQYAAINKAIEKRGWTDEIKAQAGAVVHFNYAGVLQIKLGVVKPVTKAQAATIKSGGETVDSEASDEPVGISMALQMRLSEQFTSSAQQALLSHPNAALAAMVASILTSAHGGQPISLVFHQNIKKTDESFETVFVRCLAMRDQELIAAFTAAIAPVVDMTMLYSRGPHERPAVMALVAALDEARPGEVSAMSAALQHHFDASDYFGSAPKGAIVTAIREAVGDAEAKRLAGSKKKDLVTYALARVVNPGWLSPELRVTSYSGPDVTESKAA